MLPFSVMAKPVGSLCNLNCTYCYYLEKDKLYPGETYRKGMNNRVLEDYIVQVIASSREPVIQFAWHGGEPILRGMEFFENVIRLQHKHGYGRQIENSLQTNGTTLTDDWCRFLSAHRFLVGLSIDGPEHCHDRYRRYRDGRGSFSACMKGAELLVKHNVDFNTLTVVHDYNAKFPTEIYRFLKSIGSRYMQFLPVVERVDPAAGPDGLRVVPPERAGPAEVTDWTVDPMDYGTFLTTVFDEWVRHDVGKCFVITFDCVLANWMRVPPPVCVAAGTCGNAGALEFNGDLYSCDHYVFPEYSLGNILGTGLQKMMTSETQMRFGSDKRDSLPAYCRKCEYLDLCHGECPKNRISFTPDGDPGLNYLCPGFKAFYRHTEPYFAFMAAELMAERPPANVMNWARPK